MKGVWPYHLVVEGQAERAKAFVIHSMARCPGCNRRLRLEGPPPTWHIAFVWRYPGKTGFAHPICLDCSDVEMTPSEEAKRVKRLTAWLDMNEELERLRSEAT